MKIYLICPVRNRTKEQIKFADDYVIHLESQGYTVHYPPRDASQVDDGLCMTVIDEHRKAMLGCDAVYVIWDTESKGSHFDLGMAWMLKSIKPLVIKYVRRPIKTKHKSFSNVLIAFVKLSP